MGQDRGPIFPIDDNAPLYAPPLSLLHHFNLLVRSDCKSSQLESISAASLSGISLSLATVISHHHRQLLREGEVGPGGVAGGGEGGEAVTKRGGGELRNGETGVGVRGKEGGMGKEVTEPANEATVSAKLPSASPNTSHTEGAYTCAVKSSTHFLCVCVWYCGTCTMQYCSSMCSTCNAYTLRHKGTISKLDNYEHSSSVKRNCRHMCRIYTSPFTLHGMSYSACTCSTLYTWFFMYV